MIHRKLFIKPLLKKRYLFIKSNNPTIYVIVHPHMLSPRHINMIGYYLLINNNTLPYSKLERQTYINDILKLKNPKILKISCINDINICYISCDIDSKKFILESIKTMKDTYIWKDHYIIKSFIEIPVIYNINNIKIDQYEIANTMRNLLFNI